MKVESPLIESIFCHFQFKLRKKIFSKEALFNKESDIILK